MEKIQKVLREAGLTENEAAVYISLLHSGAASAYRIAEKAGIKPSTTYLTLQNLMTKGLAYSVPRAKKQLFSAKNPRELVSELEDRTARTKRVLPEMLALIPSDTPKINVQYYQGLKGVEDALDYGRKHGRTGKEIVGFYASGENTSEDFLELSRKYMARLHKTGTHMRAITPKHASTDEFIGIAEKLQQEMRTVPYKEYSSKVSIEAEEDFVRIILNNWQRALIIDNPELAQTVKQIFEMVWKKSVELKS